MSDEVSKTAARSDWPMFAIRHAYNPKDVATDVTFEPNEIVFYDAQRFEEGRWMSAKYGSYTPITEIR